MRPIEDVLIPTRIENGPHAGFMLALVQALVRHFTQIKQRVNGLVPKDGTEAMGAPLVLATYTVATRPTAASWTGGIIYVSDGAAGAKFQASNGGSWVNLG